MVLCADEPRRRQRRSDQLIRYLPIAILLAAFWLVQWAIGLTSASWLVLATKGIYPTALVGAAAGWGCWPAKWLGMAGKSRIRFWCTATALGVGIVSSATFCLAAAGFLSHPVAIVLLAAGIVLGLVGISRSLDLPAPGQDEAAAADARHWTLKAAFLTPLVVPLATAIYGTTLPPGLLWSGEGRGYDVLEYHLQVPREYFEAGRLHFLPHNVYGSFPQQVEIMYLLLMYLHGSAHEAAIPAQILHASFGALTVVALATWTVAGWTRVLVLLTVGTVPWVGYLACLAYVELGMLFLAAVAGGILWAGLCGRQALDWRSALAAGLCAGWAGGCKYTAIVFVPVAMLVAGLAAWAVRTGAQLKRQERLGRLRLVPAAAFPVGALAALCPWLIRNAVLTGNPVYPFAYGWFDGKAWSAEQAEQWARGHRLPAEQSGLTSRARIAFDELLGSGMYGPAIWVLGLAAVFRSRSRRVVFPVGWVLVLLATWTLTTRMPGRFAVAVIVPLALLLDELALPTAAASGRQRLSCFVWLGLAAGAGLLNDWKLFSLLKAESTAWQRQTGVPLPQMAGRVDVMVQANPINAALAQAAGRTWLVGEARAFYVTCPAYYAVVFSRDPWLEFCASEDPRACVDWLRTRGVTHVVFSWSEIERLRSSYDFKPLVTREWVSRLAEVGLPLRSRQADAFGRPVIEIYEVLPE